MLVLIAAILFSTTAGAAALRPLSQVEGGASTAWPSSLVGCDDGTNLGTLIQRGDLLYGNRLQSPCAGARLRRIAFVHAGSSSPSAYRLHVRDASCNEIGVTPVRFTTATNAAPHLEEVDVADYGWCAHGDVRVFVEPLSCPQPSDCFPAVVVDAGTGGDCAEVAVPNGGGRSCLAARTSDGRPFAFRIRAEFECSASACITATRSRTWTAAKQLYDVQPAPRY